MPAQTFAPIKTLDRYRMTLAYLHRHGAGNPDACLLGQRHGGMLYQGRVDGLKGFIELQQARLAVHVQQCLGPCATQRGTGGNQATLVLIDGFTGKDLMHEPLNLQRVCEQGQRPHAARQVLLGRCRNTQGTETLVPGVVEKVQNSQARRLVKQADHTLTPAVGPCIIHRAGGCLFFNREELTLDQGQVFAERKAGPQPRIPIFERYALGLACHAQLPDKTRIFRTAEPPEIK